MATFISVVDASEKWIRNHMMKEYNIVLGRHSLIVVIDRVHIKHCSVFCIKAQTTSFVTFSKNEIKSSVFESNLFYGREE